MEIDPNPYASPPTFSSKTADLPGSSMADLPELPLVFRKDLIDFLMIIPIAVLTGGAFLFCLLGVLAALNDDEIILAIPLGIFALFTGSGFLGCLSGALCKVQIDRESIQIRQILSQRINFKDIKSWHFHPVYKCVVISFFGKRDSLLLSNMVMSKRRNQIVGQVLTRLVGPAGMPDVTR